MSLVHLANVCSHLQNASKARLSLTSIPSTHHLLTLVLILQSQGFLSSVTRGSIHGPDKTFTPTTQENVATRRLWLGLKYFDNEPVLRNMGMVSKPSKRIYMGFQGFRDLARGKKADYVRPLEPGECMIVSTDKGVMELRDAVDRLLGGQILCRIS